jgi:hypothetical protein
VIHRSPAQPVSVFEAAKDLLDFLLAGIAHAVRPSWEHSVIEMLYIELSQKLIETGRTIHLIGKEVRGRTGLATAGFSRSEPQGYVIQTFDRTAGGRSPRAPN